MTVHTAAATSSLASRGVLCADSCESSLKTSTRLDGAVEQLRPTQADSTVDQVGGDGASSHHSSRGMSSGGYLATEDLRRTKTGRSLWADKATVNRQRKTKTFRSTLRDVVLHAGIICAKSLRADTVSSSHSAALSTTATCLHTRSVTALPFLHQVWRCKSPKLAPKQFDTLPTNDRTHRKSQWASDPASISGSPQRQSEASASWSKALQCK